PPSATSPTFRFAFATHVWYARRISRCHCGWGVVAPISAERSLGVPEMFVPSGTKLSVRLVPLNQGAPPVGGVRPSSCSHDRRLGGSGWFISGLGRLRATERPVCAAGSWVASRPSSETAVERRETDHSGVAEEFRWDRNQTPASRLRTGVDFGVPNSS